MPECKQKFKHVPRFPRLSEGICNAGYFARTLIEKHVVAVLTAPLSLCKPRAKCRLMSNHMYTSFCTGLNAPFASRICGLRWRITAKPNRCKSFTACAPGTSRGSFRAGTSRRLQIPFADEVQTDARAGGLSIVQVTPQRLTATPGTDPACNRRPSRSCPSCKR